MPGAEARQGAALQQACGQFWLLCILQPSRQDRRTIHLEVPLADARDNAWLTTFHEAAEQVVGLNAEEAQSIEQGVGGREALEGAIVAKYFDQPLQLTARAKFETYNGESRMSVSCIGARPVPRGQHGRAMLKEVLEHVRLAAEKQ